MKIVFYSFIVKPQSSHYVHRYDFQTDFTAEYCKKGSSVNFLRVFSKTLKILTISVIVLYKNDF